MSHLYEFNIVLSQGENSVQPYQDSHPGLSDYRSDAVSTELSGRYSHTSSA